MKTSTKNLIIYTILGIMASIVLYNLNQAQNLLILKRVSTQIEIGIYVCPFIGLIYWLYTRNLE